MSNAVEYAVESAEDDDGDVVGVVVTFEFDDVDSDDQPITREKAASIANAILDGRWSSTTLI